MTKKQHDLFVVLLARSESFAVCSSLITAVRNIFIKTNKQMDGISVFISNCKKNCDFLKWGAFTLALSVEDAPVILNEMACRVLATHWVIYMSMNFA